MATLSDPAAELFATLPASYGADRDDVDPIVARWLGALAFEVARHRGLLVALLSTTIPAVADDTVGSLSRWEDALGLPVAPDGVSVAQRRAKLLGALQGRRVAYGRDWTAAMTAAIGSDDWTVHENTPGANQLTIEIPFAPGSYNAGQVEEIARRKTPANQEIVMSYAGAFIVGASRVGDAL
jgi:hypothetical protein